MRQFWSGRAWPYMIHGHRVEHNTGDWMILFIKDTGLLFLYVFVWLYLSGWWWLKATRMSFGVFFLFNLLAEFEKEQYKFFFEALVENSQWNHLVLHFCFAGCFNYYYRFFYFSDQGLIKSSFSSWLVLVGCINLQKLIHFLSVQFVDI